MKELVETHLKKSMDYQTYRSLVDDLVAQEKTTGPNQSESMVHYTKLSAYRMKRLDKTAKIDSEVVEQIKNIEQPMTWLTITEGWCGDAGQIIPFIEKLAELNPLITSRYILRDENPELIDAFLTNGGRSIPIVIVIDDQTGEVINHWGPRPSYMQNTVMARKTDPKASPYIEFMVEAQKWYNDDKGVSTVKEFTEALLTTV